MATDNSGYPYLPMLAAGDLSSDAGKIMQKNTTADQVALATAATQVLIGILQNKPAAAGRAATVQVAGIAKVEAGAAITVGDLLTTDGAGLAITFVPTAATVEWIIGIAMTGAAAANEMVEVMLIIQTVSTET